MENDKFSNLDFDLGNTEENVLSVFNTDNIFGNNNRSEFGKINQIDEVNLDNKSEKSIVSRQDVADMISEKISESNNYVIETFDKVRMDIDEIRSDMLQLKKNTKFLN